MAKLIIEGDRASIEGELTFSDVAKILAEFDRALTTRAGGAMAIDLSRLERIDSGGAALLDEVVDRGQARNVSVTLGGASPEVKEIRRIFEIRGHVEPVAREDTGAIHRLGLWGYRTWDSFLAYLQLTADTFYWSLLGLITRKGY